MDNNKNRDKDKASLNLRDDDFNIIVLSLLNKRLAELLNEIIS